MVRRWTVLLFAECLGLSDFFRPINSLRSKYSVGWRRCTVSGRRRPWVLNNGLGSISSFFVRLLMAEREHLQHASSGWSKAIKYIPGDPVPTTRLKRQNNYLPP
jgi:hypothetical protein